MTAHDDEWLYRRYVVDGARVADIAAEAGITTSAVYRRLHAAISGCADASTTRRGLTC